MPAAVEPTKPTTPARKAADAPAPAPAPKVGLRELVATAAARAHLSTDARSESALTAVGNVLDELYRALPDAVDLEPRLKALFEDL
jgi:hypothetical protein